MTKHRKNELVKSQDGNFLQPMMENINTVHPRFQKESKKIPFPLRISHFFLVSVKHVLVFFKPQILQQFRWKFNRLVATTLLGHLFINNPVVSSGHSTTILYPRHKTSGVLHISTVSTFLLFKPSGKNYNF